MKKPVVIYIFIWLAIASVYSGSSAIATQTNSFQSVNNTLAQNNGIKINFSDSQSQDNLTKVIVLLGLVGTSALFWYLFKSHQSASPIFQPNRNSDTVLLDRVSPKLRRQLLRLINDPKTVNRLLMGIYKNNRDRSPNWLAEKAIYDLKRGR